MAWQKEAYKIKMFNTTKDWNSKGRKYHTTKSWFIFFVQCKKEDKPKEVAADLTGTCCFSLDQSNQAEVIFCTENHMNCLTPPAEGIQAHPGDLDAGNLSDDEGDEGTAKDKDKKKKKKKKLKKKKNEVNFSPLKMEEKSQGPKFDCKQIDS